MSAAKSYLITAWFFGLAFLIVTPPYQVPDEANHFFRAYQVADGKVRGERLGDASGGILPKGLQTEAHRLDRLPFNLAGRTSFGETEAALGKSVRLLRETTIDNTEFVPFANTVRYTPVPYFAQALGIALCRYLQTPALFALYVARFFNLLMVMVITALAIRLLPTSLRWSIAVLALMPMNLFLAASASADGLTTAFAFLVFALGLLAFRSRRLWSAYVLASMALALSKTAYFLLPLLAPIVVAGKGAGKATRGNNPLRVAAKPHLVRAPFKFRVHRALWIAGIGLLLNVAWLLVIAKLLTALRSDVHVDSWQQLHVVLGEPLRFLRLIAADTVQGIWFYLDSFVGRLGHLDVYLPRWALDSYLILLGLLAVVGIGRGDLAELNPPRRVALLALFLTTWLLLVFVTYVTWVPLGLHPLEGMQGRYFLPIAPLLFLVIPKVRLPERAARIFALWIPRIAVALWTIVLTTSVITLVKRYYLR